MSTLSEVTSALRSPDDTLILCEPLRLADWARRHVYETLGPPQKRLSSFNWVYPNKRVKFAREDGDWAHRATAARGWLGSVVHWDGDTCDEYLGIVR